MYKRLAPIVVAASLGLLAMGLGIRMGWSPLLVAAVQGSPSPPVCTSGNNRCTETEIQLARSALPVVIRPAEGTPLTRDRAVSLTAGQAGVVLRSTRINAKLTTWGAYQAVALPNGSGPTTGFSSDQQIWLVAVAGTIKPGYGHGISFPWAVFIYDAATGFPLGINTGPNGSWPPYFDSLTDLAAH
jgi:hypothetical protein